MSNVRFGMMKTLIDAHTMGIHAASALLTECGYDVIIAPKRIEDALGRITSESYQKVIIDWIKDNKINHLGISYRLDPSDAVEIVKRLVWILKKENLFQTTGAQIQSIHFAGLSDACEKINNIFDGEIKTFKGGESPEETLLTMGVPASDIPKHIIEGCKYDKELLKFGKQIVLSGEYKSEKKLERNKYKQFGTFDDSLMLRLTNNFAGEFAPLIRAHSGPYSPDLTRLQCLKEYNEWCRDLAVAGYLDILSIGTSQLSQSNFGEDWSERLNGGGVPVNSEQEFLDIWMAANPMLVRTYSGTKNVKKMAQMYEKTINNAWNALSLWWFDELDGRGPNTLYQNLKEHIETMKYIASINKPFEANVSHHFAFRGCDDITYVVTAFLAAKMAKKCGIKVFILQNMLNTPRSTWGIQDLAKSRAMLSLIKSLEDDSFRVVLQTRAGLDYFKPDINAAKEQLAAVTALMDDIDPENMYSPEIIHVVSYSEALFLATPEILNDSIKLVRCSLRKYREQKKKGNTYNTCTDEINNRTYAIENASRQIIDAMEKNIYDLYSAEGFYLAFVAGWLPVPELWSDSQEFINAKAWSTRNRNGGICIVDKGMDMTIESRINKCVSNMPEANYILSSKYHISSVRNIINE